LAHSPAQRNELKASSQYPAPSSWQAGLPVLAPGRKETLYLERDLVFVFSSLRKIWVTMNKPTNLLNHKGKKPLIAS
jgi:hypothetical protein